MKKSGLKSEIKELGSKKSKKKIYLALIILVVGVIGINLYFFSYIPKSCENIECYGKALVDCRKVWVINEDENYVWRYEILNEGNNNCNVEVILLKMKDGTINVEDLEGKSMVCRVEKVGDILPEKDMLRCSGILKEELQEIIIDRLHNYLLENIGEINENLKRI